MTYTIGLFLFSMLALGWYAFYGLRRDGWRKYIGPIGYCIICTLALFGFGQSLGRCIPAWALKEHHVDVITIYYDQPNNIYLWAMSGDGPQCVVLPWSNNQATDIRGMENEGGPLEFVPGNGMDAQGVVHPKPQEPLPPKQAVPDMQ